MIRAIAALLLALAPGLAAAGGAPGCRAVSFEEVPYTICEADAGRDDIRLFLRDDGGTLLGQFGRAAQQAEANGQRLVFAMNAGMYRPDRSPAGLYIEDGVQERPLVTREGPGNFGLLPNGVFCVTEGRARVIETLAFAAAPPACRHATQSGPMLVIGGALHPRFLPDSSSRYIRNGVGTGPDGRRVVFAISEAPVTFHQFARLFRDGLGLDDALYLDGSVSRLHAPGLGRSGLGFPLGPMVGVTVPR